MADIYSYLLKDKRKIHKLSTIWILILAFIMSGLIIINNSIKLKNYYMTSGITKDANLILMIPINRVDDIVSKKTLYIGKNKYFYDVEKIQEEIITIQNEFYKEIIIKVNLKNKNFIDNNIVELKFIINEMTILEYISNFFKGG